MSRSLSTYARPEQLTLAVKEKITKMMGDWVFINWQTEEMIFGSSPVPMEKLGKMIALMNNNCVTVRKPKKESKL